MACMFFVFLSTNSCHSLRRDYCMSQHSEERTALDCTVRKHLPVVQYKHSILECYYFRILTDVGPNTTQRTFGSPERKCQNEVCTICYNFFHHFYIMSNIIMLVNYANLVFYMTLVDYLASVFLMYYLAVLCLCKRQFKSSDVSIGWL